MTSKAERKQLHSFVDCRNCVAGPTDLIVIYAPYFRFWPWLLLEMRLVVLQVLVCLLVRAQWPRALQALLERPQQPPHPHLKPGTVYLLGQ